MKKPVAILTKDFVNLFANLTYAIDCQAFILHTYIHTPQILIQETLKFFIYFLKTSEESNIDIEKKEITIWRLGKNDLDYLPSLVYSRCRHARGKTKYL